MYCIKFPLFFFLILLSSSCIVAQKEEQPQNTEKYKQYLELSYHEIDSLVMIPYQKQDFETCILYMKAGRDKAIQDFGNQDSIFSEYTSGLAFFYEQTRQYPLALPLALETLEINKNVLGTEHPIFANSLNNLALLYKKMGDYTKALPLYIQAKNIYEKILGREHAAFARSLNNLASLHQSMGNFQLALPLYIQAKNIREKALGIEHPLFAISLNNLASLHQSMGNFQLALPLYIQAKNIRKKTLGMEHSDFASSLNNLASLHKAMDNFDLALPLYIQASDIYKKALGVEHPLFATSLNNLAILHRIMGNAPLALPLYIQAKNIRKEALGVEHPDFVTSLNNLGEFYQNRGDYSKAWEVVQQAMNCASSIDSKHSFDKIWLDSLVVASYPSHKLLENMVTSLSLVYRLLEEDPSITKVREQQIFVADLAEALLTQIRHQVSSEEDKLRMLSESNDWLQKSLTVLTSLETKKAFNLSDQNKSVLLLQATKSEQNYKLGELPNALIWEDRKLLQKQSELQAKLVEKRSKEEKDSLLNELNRVHLAIDAFAKMIKKEYPKYHKLKYQHTDAKVEDIQQLLEETDALLEYVIGDSVIHVFYVDKKEIQWFKTFVSNKKLTTHIQSLHEALNSYKNISKNSKAAYSQYTKEAYWFYKNLVAPALKGRTEIKNLIIVSDGELGHLPFDAFLTAQAPQEETDYQLLPYLVHDYNISYNYSATLWKENKEVLAPANNGQILGVAANYAAQLDSAIINLRLPADQWLRASLQPLPAARQEVETLQNQFEGLFAFDKQASEKMVKEKASDFAILHFAMHGILEKNRPMLSSLAFTEDGDSIESNFWQAHEISKIQLNANLVVLSACETGYGRFETGNGIASLARSFMYAGSPALVVSLWQVNDFVTSEIMKKFYNNLADGMKKDKALRQAKLAYIKSASGIAAHPTFWSSFIIMGKTDAVQIKRKENSLIWGIGFGILAILAFAGFLWKSKKMAYFA